MPVCGKNFNLYLGVEDEIYHPMLFRYLSAPSIFGLAFQLLGMTCAGLGMFFKFFEETSGFCKDFRLTFGETLKMFRCLGEMVTLYFIAVAFQESR